MHSQNKTIYDFQVKKSNGELLPLNQFRGKVLLIVNTASKCGFTPQYAELQKLHEKYEGAGLVILGFPCNQFGHQEPGDAKEINDFCSLNFGVTFPILEKIDVNGEHADPLFDFLKEKASGLMGTQAIKWNFTKFLVNRTGDKMERFAPTTEPKSMVAEIESLLAQKAP